MAHANIDERREYVKEMILSKKSFAHIYSTAPVKFTCSPSAIRADINEILCQVGLKESNFKTGVYFLLQGKEIVYIGQTFNWPRRLNSHKKDKVFDSFRLIECDKSVLNYYERRFIRYFKPKYNQAFKSPCV